MELLPFPVVDQISACMCLDWFSEQGLEDLGKDFVAKSFHDFAGVVYFFHWYGTATKFSGWTDRKGTSVLPNEDFPRTVFSDDENWDSCTGTMIRTSIRGHFHYISENTIGRFPGNRSRIRLSI